MASPAGENKTQMTGKSQHLLLSSIGGRKQRLLNEGEMKALPCRGKNVSCRKAFEEK
jgi:hypothetical protein